MAALSPWMWLVGYGLLIAATVVFPNPVMLLILLLGGLRDLAAVEGPQVGGSGRSSTAFDPRPGPRSRPSTSGSRSLSRSGWTRRSSSAISATSDGAWCGAPLPRGATPGSNPRSAALEVAQARLLRLVCGILVEALHRRLVLLALRLAAERAALRPGPLTATCRVGSATAGAGASSLPCRAERLAARGRRGERRVLRWVGGVSVRLGAGDFGRCSRFSTLRTSGTSRARTSSKLIRSGS